MTPIDTQDPRAATRAYADLLGWHLAVGYRYRPRAGCTCGDADCPVPGAHPVAGEPRPGGPEDLAVELENTPGAGLIAYTTAFDAVCVNRSVGMAALIGLEQEGPVPCLVAGGIVALLVLPGTGRYALGGYVPGEVRSGPDQWVAVPPTIGVRWDTPPWIEPTTAPAPLMDGATVGLYVRRAYRSGADVGGRA